MNKKIIHVVHILPSFGFGGAERYVLELVNNASENFRFTIIVFFNVLSLSKEITSSHVKIIPVLKTSKFGIGLIFKLRKVLQDLKPDIVHTHLFAGDFWGRIAARKLQIPIITTEHNMNDSEGWLKNWLRKLFRNYSDQYVACSKEVKAYAEKKYNITKPYSVIYGGVNIERFNSTSYQFPKTSWQLLIVGRLTRQKGHEWALQALGEMKSYSWRLDIFGEGEEKEALCELVKKLGLEKRVSFFPGTNKIEEVYKKHDIVLVPSLWEGLGLVVLEAMAAEKLVIASEVGGIKEIIKNKKTGLFVVPFQNEMLKKQLKFVFEKPQIAEQIAEEGRKLVKECFTVEKMVEEYKKLYLKFATH